jgi:hypothetical protein
MSKMNGDRSRFQRNRKAGLLRRERSRATYTALKSAAAATRAASSDAEQSGGARGPLETLHPEKADVAAEPVRLQP